MLTRRYLMFFSYVGSDFRGSQIQVAGKDFKTVQCVIEEALKNVFSLSGERPIRVFMCSRTDKGVHALRTAVHGLLPPFKGEFLEPENLLKRLNKYLLESQYVRILEAYLVNDSLKISSAVLHKTYLYRVGLLKKEFFNSNDLIAPIMEINRTHFIRNILDFDVKKAEEATSLFEGKKDFGAIIGRPSHNLLPTSCNIMSFNIKEAQPLVPFDPITERYNYYQFICKGDRFLFHMVRRMVTLALSAGYNIITSDDIEKLFSNPVPSSWPNRTLPIVSGGGLYLVNSFYDLEKLKFEPITETLKEKEVKLLKDPDELFY